MNIIALTSLSFGMSMDAFAAALAKGATDKHPRFIKALKGGLFFGVIEGIAPLMGFLLGTVASDKVASFDHWVAFGLLGFLGVRFIREALYGTQSDQPQRIGFAMLLLTAVATSVDSVVVGVSLAFLEANIWLASVLIGMATAIMATTGLYVGHRLSEQFGRVAMGCGGVVLMVIGVFILYTHLVA